MNLGTFKILNNMITACDYSFILKRIEKSIDSKIALLISPIASQTLVKAFYDTQLKKTLDMFDHLVPDSQWVRHALWLLHGIRIKDRIYGPELMLKVCKLAQKNQYSIYLYGCRDSTLQLLKRNLTNLFPQLIISGSKPSLFRPLNSVEQIQLIKELDNIKPSIVFIGLGSPLQEQFAVWLSKNRNHSPAVYIPAGAAFDFISGTKKQAPKMWGDLGFEWLYRLIQEPTRLWYRYLIDGPLFIYLLLKQRFTS